MVYNKFRLSSICMSFIVATGLAACNPVTNSIHTATTALTTSSTTDSSTRILTTLSTITQVYSTIPSLNLPDVNDYIITKYDSNGKTIWQNIEDFGEHDSSVSVNIDESGNSYIIGSNYDAKYDNNGKQVYFNALTNSNIVTSRSFIDAGDNIYLLATPSTSGINIYKYDKNGKQVWVNQYQYPGHLTTLPTGFTLDTNGNIYITGFTSDPSDAPNDRLLLLKYDNQGNLLWSVQDDGLMQGNTAIGPVVDNNGNIYVTGSILKPNGNSTTNYTYVTVKYDTNGTKQWESDYTTGFGSPTDIKVDPNGNIIVVGETSGLNSPEIATIKYDSTGKQLWVSSYASGGIPSAMAIDSQGNIYITGTSLSGTNYVTIKYDSNGYQQWDAQYAGKGTGLLNKASALFVDDNGNIYVTGECGLDSEYVTYDTIKYDDAGNQLWVTSYSKSDFIDKPDMLMVDALGNVYMIGRIANYSK
jgi:hypothetical protein